MPAQRPEHSIETHFKSGGPGPYDPGMGGRFQEFRNIGRATFPKYQRTLDVLGIVSIFLLVGVTITGIWQFFAHESNPQWFAYQPGNTLIVEPPLPTGVALAHRFFADGAGIVALFGGAWFSYRIAFRVPAAIVVAFVCILFGVLTEALVRYNIIKIAGLTFEEVGPGYSQLFTGDVEYVVTDARQQSRGAFLLVVVSHIATIPILVGFGWRSIVQAIDRRAAEIRNAPKRTWFTS